MTTTYAGFSQFEVQHRFLIRDARTGQVLVVTDFWKSLSDGLIYSAGVMTILVFHEMGHYLQARRYHVPASPPYFLPMPIPPVGTMGAVIVQRAGVADRKSMFDIAITGPIAGMVIALPLAWWGIQQSLVVTAPPGESLPGYNDPLILQWIVRYFFGPLAPNQDVLLNPLLFAGWVGCFITALNLFPIGQLDGGHILYCLLGRKAHVVAQALFYFGVAAVAINVMLGNYGYVGWTLMLLLLWFFGTRHPPTANDSVPLGPVRIFLGWLALGFVFIGFTPSPFRMSPSQPTAPRPQSVEKATIVNADMSDPTANPARSASS